MAPPSRSGSRSPVVLVVVGVALAVGAAAVALGSPATPTGGRTWAFDLSPGAVAAVLLLLVAAGLGIALYQRATDGGLGIVGRFVVYALVFLLLVVLCVVVGRTLVGPAHVATATKAAPDNGTSGAPNATRNLTHNITGTAPPVEGFVWPAWALFAAVGLVLIVGAAVALVPLRGLFGRDGKSVGVVPGAAAAARDDLARATAALDAGADPRAVILALYAALLAHLTPMVGDLDPSTPEEIRSLHLVRLGIRPAAALALTRLFEEARYSSHPIDAATATRARVILGAAQADLVRPARAA